MDVCGCAMTVGAANRITASARRKVDIFYFRSSGMRSGADGIAVSHVAPVTFP